MHIRDRVKELRRVKAGLLRPNPKNWRTHPQAQQDVLRGVLAEIGYAGALLARELPDGTLELLDGHLRAETTPDMEVPVLVVDLDDREAAKLLAVHDPLAGMAEANEQALAELLAEVETESDAMQALLGPDACRRATGRGRPGRRSGDAARGGRARMFSGRHRVRRRRPPAGGLRAAQRRGFEVPVADAVANNGGAGFSVRSA